MLNVYALFIPCVSSNVRHIISQCVVAGVSSINMVVFSYEIHVIFLVPIYSSHNAEILYMLLWSCCKLNLENSHLYIPLNLL